MIFKPSEVTSLTTLKLAEIYTEAGLPAGVFNVLTGSGREVGTWLTEHPRIEKISFTGGTDTGKKVMASASASSLKDVTMELGGKSPLIIFDDADLDRIVPGADTGHDAQRLATGVNERRGAQRNLLAFDGWHQTCVVLQHVSAGDDVHVTGFGVRLAGVQGFQGGQFIVCLLYTSPSPRDS